MDASMGTVDASSTSKQLTITGQILCWVSSLIQLTDWVSPVVFELAEVVRMLLLLANIYAATFYEGCWARQFHNWKISS